LTIVKYTSPVSFEFHFSGDDEMNSFDNIQSDELQGRGDYDAWAEYQAYMAAESEFEHEDYDDDYDPEDFGQFDADFDQFD